MQQPPPTVDSTTSPAAMPERDNQLPHSLAARAERSMSPVGDKDPSDRPPHAHVKRNGK
jgi:hypothetical protein